MRKRQTNVETRKADGVVYTPPEVVRHILRQTLEPFLAAGSLFAPRVLDPACGDGAFLIEVYRTLLRRYCPEGESGDAPGDHSFSDSEVAHRVAILRDAVFGLDTDRLAVEAARRRLAAIALGLTADEDEQIAERQTALAQLAASLTATICWGDALRTVPGLASPPWLQATGFEVIVANPPYVGARRLAKNREKSLTERYRQTYRCAGGSSDLYAIFLERIYELLAEGGRFGVIAPNRLAVADYARPCRELLLGQTRIDRIDDVSRLRVFPSAAVYPIVVCGTKQRPEPKHRIAFSRPASLAALDVPPGWFASQSAIDPTEGIPLRPRFELALRVPTRPLGDLATLHSGTTGFAARQMADALVERGEAGGEAWDFITTGNIDRYQVRLGDVRFQRRRYVRPGLPCAAPFLSDHKRRLYREPKMVFAGLSRRLEAAWSEGGLALGVQVFAAAEWRVDPFYALAILNSLFFAHLFCERLGAKRLAGGYLALHKSQLSRLPIRTLPAASAATRNRGEDLAKSAFCLTQQSASSPDEAAAAERTIDELVFELYGVSSAEREQIEVALAGDLPAGS